MNKLQLGCGRVYIPGWTNVDIFSSTNADLYADVQALPFPRESFNLIYSSHVLEHVHRHTVLATLTHWRDLLVPGGVLRLAVPDFAAVAAWYQKTGDLGVLLGLLYGGQNHPKNNHFITFDRATLTDALKRVGFTDITEWDWRETEHTRFDDYSRAYLPHRDFEHGMLMSLNLEATK